ncbi:MAG: hypothetical protein L3J75_06990 [Methylococcaceae bacterium]|nr:hypothetical protein [Methylococcaceae bacterium]
MNDLAFEKMQRNYRHELNIVTERSRALAKRGTPLTDVERGRHIAQSSRTAVKLNVMSQVQASNLVKFAKQAKFLGNGLAVIDFGTRVGNIHNSYQTGGDWERDLFIESSSFSASVVAGTLAVNGGLALLMVAIPVGWVAVVAGLAIAGVAAASSIGMNNYVKENSGNLYDDILKWISIL